MGNFYLFKEVLWKMSVFILYQSTTEKTEDERLRMKYICEQAESEFSFLSFL